MSARRSPCARAKHTSRAPRLLRAEPLESRTVLTAVSPLGCLPIWAFSPGGNFGVYAKAPAATAPTVAKPLTAGVNSAGNVTGTSTTLSVLGSDAKGASTLVYDWTVTVTPAGGSARFSRNGSNAAQIDTVTFNEAGVYGIQVTIVDGSGLSVSSSVKVAVVQALASIVVTPGAASLQSGATQQFAAQGFDQFQRAMAPQPQFAWSAGGGKISSAGLYTAPTAAGVYGVTANYGPIAESAKVSVAAPAPLPGGLQDPVLAALVQKLVAAGPLNRADMIQILTSVGAGGTVSATDLSDLKKILAAAAQYNMPGYVQVLAGDVVNGNPANAQYQGAPLGNLAAGSSAAQLDKLVDKWFLGTDLPALTSGSLTYTPASGSLFPTTPSHNDEFQGQLGDCYFISSLGMIADSNPAAVENMFINNGDGTYTVRFYDGATADYVTVNGELPTCSNGMFAYADCGFYASSPNNALWIPLAEKAYAEWNATGNEGRNGQDSYNAIQGGWMDAVDAQVLGHSATDYNLTTSTRQAMINALAAKEAVTIGTDSSGNAADTLSYGLFGSHAYGVIGYNASTQLFTLYNPWGCDQPGGLTWGQLEATCDGFVVAVTTGSAPISSVNLSAPLAAAAASVSAAGSGDATTTSTADHEYMLRDVDSAAAWSTVPAADTASAVSPAATGETGGNRRATVFAAGSTPETPAVEPSDRPTAAGVDAVLGSEDLAVGILK
jgi:hypothetical protein